MGKFLSLLLFLLVSIGGIKSQTLTFEYESGGNQIVRKYCAMCVALKNAMTEQRITEKSFLPGNTRLKFIQILPRVK